MTTARQRIALLVVGLAAILLACGDDGAPGDAVDVESSGDGGAVVEPVHTRRTGGMGTAFDDSERAFSLTARNVNHYERVTFGHGKEIFEAAWNPRPGEEFSGLGPDFDASSCADCHRNDGRSPGPVGDGELPTGMVVRLISDEPAVIDQYGRGLSRQAFGRDPEAVVTVEYEEIDGTYDDGTAYTLRRPRYSVVVNRGPGLPDDAVIGPRVAPQLPGMGLLELIPDGDLQALADPDDGDGDGISGRLGEATDLLAGTPAIGRFGWNATQPTVEQQTATALFNDMTLTSRYFPSELCGRWAPCVRAGVPLSTEYNVEEYGDPNFGVQEPAGGEVTDRQLLDLTVYTQILAVPGARDIGDPVVERGYDLFLEAGCASCHTGGYTTRRGPIQGLSNQRIQPYTDLLLHDLGIELGDQTIGGELVSTEWRTPPLWGIGLIDTVNGHTTLLHDGRARDYAEAVLWHGGEAEASAAAFRAMPADDRAALLAFLESL